VLDVPVHGYTATGTRAILTFPMVAHADGAYAYVELGRWGFPLANDIISSSGTNLIDDEDMPSASAWLMRLKAEHSDGNTSGGG